MIDKAKMVSLRAQINAAIAEVGRKNGVSLSLGNGKFGTADAYFKLNIVDLSNVNGDVSPAAVRNVKAANDFLTRGVQFGYNNLDLNKVVVIAGKAFKIIGLMPSRSKFNTLVMDQGTKKEVLYPHTVVQKYLSAAK